MEAKPQLCSLRYISALISIISITAHVSSLLTFGALRINCTVKITQRVKTCLWVTEEKDASVFVDSSESGVTTKLGGGMSVRCLTEEHGVGTITIYDLYRQKDKFLKFLW